MEREQTIDHRYYIDYCLKPLIDNIKMQRPSCGVQRIKLHHDNGRPHDHQDMFMYLESQGIKIIPNSPNFPDMSPCDFRLFDLIKKNLADQSNAESLYRVVSHFMDSSSKEEYRKTFDKWIERMQLCVDNNGDYFEHLMK